MGVIFEISKEKIFEFLVFVMDVSKKWPVALGEVKVRIIFEMGKEKMFEYLSFCFGCTEKVGTCENYFIYIYIF